MKSEEFTREEMQALAKALRAEDSSQPDSAFRERALAGFDAEIRRRRRAFSLQAFADALGWRAIARPAAPALLAASAVIAGFAVGLVSRGANEEAYAYFASAYDEAFSDNGEEPLWDVQ